FRAPALPAQSIPGGRFRRGPSRPPPTKSTAAPPSAAPACPPSATTSRTTTSPSSSNTSAPSASSRARASAGFLDPDQDDVVAARADGEADAVAGLEVERGELLRRDADRHRFHGAHAETGDGLVADEEEVR